MKTKGSPQKKTLLVILVSFFFYSLVTFSQSDFYIHKVDPFTKSNNSFLAIDEQNCKLLVIPNHLFLFNQIPVSQLIHSIITSNANAFIIDNTLSI